MQSRQFCFFFSALYHFFRRKCLLLILTFKFIWLLIEQANRQECSAGVDPLTHLSSSFLLLVTVRTIALLCLSHHSLPSLPSLFLFRIVTNVLYLPSPFQTVTSNKRLTASNERETCIKCGEIRSVRVDDMDILKEKRETCSIPFPF